MGRQVGRERIFAETVLLYMNRNIRVQLMRVLIRAKEICLSQFNILPRVQENVLHTENLIGPSRIQPYERHFQPLDLMELSVYRG